MWKKPSFFWLGKVFHYDKLYIASIKTENAQVTYLQKPQMKIKSWMRVTCNCAYSLCKGTLRKVNGFCRSNFESNSNFVVTLNFIKKDGKTVYSTLYTGGDPQRMRHQRSHFQMFYHRRLILFRHLWRCLCAINIIWPPKMTP